MLPEPLPAAAPRSRAVGRAARAHPRVQPRLLRSERGDASSDTLKVWGGSGLGGGRARPAIVTAPRALSPRAPPAPPPPPREDGEPQSPPAAPRLRGGPEM